VYFVSISYSPIKNPRLPVMFTFKDWSMSLRNKSMSTPEGKVRKEERGDGGGRGRREMGDWTGEGPEEARGGQRRPEEARGGQRRPEEARGGQRRPEEARGGQRRPGEARRRTKGGQMRPEEAR
jgi:hypothetical protein